MPTSSSLLDTCNQHINVMLEHDAASPVKALGMALTSEGAGDGRDDPPLVGLDGNPVFRMQHLLNDALHLRKEQYQLTHAHTGTLKNS